MTNRVTVSQPIESPFRSIAPSETITIDDLQKQRGRQRGRRNFEGSFKRVSFKREFQGKREEFSKRVSRERKRKKRISRESSSLFFEGFGVIEKEKEKIQERV